MIKIEEIAGICIICIITAFIIINTMITDKHKRNKLNKPKTYIIVSLIGIIVYISTDYLEVNKWYDNKRSLTGVKMLAS